MNPVTEGVGALSDVRSSVCLSVCRMSLKPDLCAGHVRVGGDLTVGPGSEAVARRPHFGGSDMAGRGGAAFGDGDQQQAPCCVLFYVLFNYVQVPS